MSLAPRWFPTLITIAAAALATAGCGDRQQISSCGFVDDVQLPGTAARSWSSCADIAGYVHAAKAPEITLHVGDDAPLTHFVGTPATSNGRVLRVSSNAATISRADAATTGVSGDMRALHQGMAQLQIKGYSCFDGNPRHRTGCVMMRVRVLP